MLPGDWKLWTDYRMDLESVDVQQAGTGSDWGMMGGWVWNARWDVWSDHGGNASR